MSLINCCLLCSFRSIDIVAWLFMLLFCGYLFWSGFWLPVQINIHRLGFHESVLFELYQTRLNWDRFNIKSEGLTMITYKNEESYQWYIGHLQRNELFIENYTNETDSNETDYANIFVMELSWLQFSEFVSIKHQNTTDYSLYIAMFEPHKNEKCSNLEFEICLMHYLSEQQNSAFEQSITYIYTAINSTHNLNINSKSVSIALDNPRDCFVCVILLILSIAYFFIIDGLNQWHKRRKLELAFSIVCFGAYFFWIFSLSVIPIFNGTAISAQKYEYFARIQHSVTYYIGGSDWGNGATLWVFGAVLSGIWAYFMFLYYPFTTLLLECVRCAVGNDSDKKMSHNCVRVVKLPMQIGGVLIIALMSLGYLAIFVGFLCLYNPNTYLHMNTSGENENMNVSLALLALFNIWIIIPIFSCVMLCLPKSNTMSDFSSNYSIEMIDDHEFENRKKSKYIPVPTRDQHNNDSNNNGFYESDNEEKELALPIQQERDDTL